MTIFLVDKKVSYSLSQMKKLPQFVFLNISNISNMNFQFFSVLTFLYIIHYGASDEIMVTIKQGKLLGLKQRTDNRVIYYSFTNIPYAKPPLGKLRFKPPEEAAMWRGVRAVSFTPVCYQWITTFGVSNFFGVEDCLYLNVFTPSLKENSKLPVLVCIHGGEFQRGSSYECPPNNFVERDIVFVSFNYRLGLLGFLSSGDENLPGNYGLKDQVAALQWIKSNIINFGGDPNKITILGQNAGGVSVHLHMHSELSKGLFHSAISQSGTALIPWAITPTEVAKNRTRTLLNKINCLSASKEEILNCLRKIHSKILVELQPQFYLWNYEPSVIFSPTIEPSTVESAFLTKDPWKNEETNLVPWLLGLNSGEGVFKATTSSLAFYAHNKSLASELIEEVEMGLPVILMYNLTADPENIPTITSSLKKYYFEGRQMGVESTKELIKLVGDGLMNYGCMTAIKRYKFTKYVYLFDHLIHKTISKLFMSTTGIKELNLTAHGDEFITLFLIPWSQPRDDEASDVEVAERMINYWTNFIKNKNPNELEEMWEPMKTEEIRYLHITAKGDEMKTGLREDMLKFWRELPLKSDTNKSTYKVEKDEL